MRELNPSVEFANKTGLAYSAVCKPLCQKLHLPQTAFDILMFLANNPSYTCLLYTSPSPRDRG